ncbi:MAG: hypothetical protein G01um101433_287 [Parcubacteria group bacterium Gr01-1014_33]|nr:MAG: hypothetical protein G01um101433_287 [Parcubacteria group bacterium Gr01-1014_33]
MLERKIKGITYSSRFLRSLKKLSLGVQEKVRIRELIFQENAFDSRLDTHKLHGKRAGEWSYSVDYEYRIAFTFADENRVLYLDIGTHDELYR